MMAVVVITATSWLLLSVPSALAAPPANDNFADAEEIGALPATVSGDNIDATPEPGESGRGFDTSVWFRWTASATGAVLVDVCDSPDAAFGVYTGADVSNLQWVTGMAFVGSGCTQTFVAAAGTTYHLSVGAVPEGAFTLRLKEAQPPANDSFADALPLSIGDKVNGTTIGSTVETSEPSLPYHPTLPPFPQTVWYEVTVSSKQRLETWICLNEGGSPTASVIVDVYKGTALGNLSLIEGGNYCVQSFPVEPGTSWVRVSSPAGDEGNFTLNLNAVPRPDNDDIADAELLPPEMGLEVDGTTVGATPEPGETYFSGELSHASVWYRWTAPQDRAVQVDACGIERDPVLFVYEVGADGQRIPRLSDLYGCDTEDADYPPAILNVGAGKEYLISVDNGQPEAWTQAYYGDFTLYIDDADPPVIDDGDPPVPPTTGPRPRIPRTPPHTGRRAAALKKCTKLPSVKKRKKCRRKAALLPV
jgi:hypothetical protein